MIPTESITMAIYLLCGLTLAAFGILLTGFYYFGDLTMPGISSWVLHVMIPLGVVTIIVGEREARYQHGGFGPIFCTAHRGGAPGPRAARISIYKLRRPQAGRKQTYIKQ